MTTTRYVVAPREPTIEMQRANGSSLVEDEVSRAWLDRDARETWAAMLAAIPDDPAAPVLVEREEYSTLRQAFSELAFIKGYLKSFLDVRMGAYTDKQYGKGELRKLIDDGNSDKKGG